MAGLGFLLFMVLLVVAPIADFSIASQDKGRTAHCGWCGSRTGDWNCAWSTIEKRSTGRGSWVRTDVLWWHLGFRSQN